MLKLLIKYEKFNDLINIHQSENIISLLLGGILCWLFHSWHLYEKLDMYYSVIQNTISVFMSGYIGMVGFSLSGMAIILTVFNKTQVRLIEEYVGKDSIEQIMSSYVFLAFLSAINIAVLVIAQFALTSDQQKISEWPFWILFFLTIYLSMLNIFYAVALVGNCISLFTISKLYSGVGGEFSNITDIANDVKTDLVLGILVQMLDISREDIMKGLENEASGLPEDTRNKVMDYLKKHYPQS